MLRKCKQCGIEATAEQEMEELFCKHSQSTHGFRNLCKSCKAEVERKYRKDNYEEYYSSKKERYSKLNPEERSRKAAEQAKARRAKYTPEELKEQQYFRHTKHKYSVTEEMFYEMLEDQGHSCKICHCTIDRTNINIDHNHETGEVRALLCYNCNTLLGKANDSPKLLKAAFEYLETHSHYGE